MSAPVIDLRGVTKRFGKREVLRGLDFTLAAGEVVGMLGPNGAGKSTCLRILVGIVRRDAGTALVHGLDPARDSLAIRRLTSYLPGETAVYAGMSGGEFLEFANSFHGKLDRDRERRLLADFELPLARKVRTYSAGMKQKLALIATLVPDVPLYVLDEPDRALDATARLQLRDRLADLRGLGKTILLSSHHLSEMEALASRTVFVLGGSCVADERVRAVRAELRREVRVRLAAGTELPPGWTTRHADPDGTLRIRTEGDPLEWAARLPRAAIESLEVGTTRLDLLYQRLTESAP